MGIPMNRPREGGSTTTGQGSTTSGQGIPAPPSAEELAALYGSVARNQSWNPPKRWAIVNGKWKFDAHQGIVMANGTIRPEYYNLNNEPEQIWYSMNPQLRLNVIEVLKSKGVSVSTPDMQLNAFGDLLRTSNALGVEWKTALNRFQALPSAKTSSGPSYRVANPADLKALVKAVFRETLGREANEAEANQFVTQYQQQQIQGQRGTVQAPSGEVAAQAFARQVAPREAGAYDLLNYIGLFADAARGIQ